MLVEYQRCCSLECDGGVKTNGELLDIVIISSGLSETASLWVTYLTTCFQQISTEQSQPPFKLVCVRLEDVLVGMTALAQNEKLSKARLQIVILCPSFLDQIKKSPGPATALSTLLQPSRVFAMLLGVNDESVTIQHRAALLCFDEWRKVVVKDQDPTFVGDFLGVAMDILSRSWQIQHAINQLRTDEKKAQFSIIPKKVKVGQNKLIILLNDPLDEHDEIHVSVDKNGTRLEPTSVKRRNPYTIQFAMPVACLQVSMIASVFVEKNGKPLGHRLVKCECRMQELDQLLRTTDNPMQFMCQALGLNPGEKDQLDVFLVASLQRNLPPHFNLLQPAGHRYHSANSEYPTLLHFAARFGLEKLSWQLLECPGGEQACSIRNACQLTPADIAERAGHHKLANALKGYLQMTELSSMYSYLKGISDKHTPGFSEANYLLPRPLNDTYLVPPAARPVTSASTPTSPPPFYCEQEFYKIPPSPILLVESPNYNIPPAPLPLEHNKLPHFATSPTSPSPTSPSKHMFPFGGYIEMHAEKNQDHSPKVKEKSSHCHYYENRRHDDQLPTNLPSPLATVQDCSNAVAPSEHCRKNSASSSSSSTKLSLHGTQDELAEIINDFKNHVITIAEVEKLVASWQNRHDVQQSFKEKQEQLNAMREEYERIQHKMKTHLKRPTPFERIKKFFSRGKSKHGTCSAECQRQQAKTHGDSIINNMSSVSVCHRPTSSLSLHSSCSSGSSGRMSIASGTSLGDSGTHSDHDDKKHSVQNDVLSHGIRSRLNGEAHQNSSSVCSIPLDSHSCSKAGHMQTADYVNTDQHAVCMTGTLKRLTSLTFEDTIIEDQETVTVESEEGATEEKALETEEEIREVTDEGDRGSDKQDTEEKGMAVVEIHNPPKSDVEEKGESEIDGDNLAEDSKPAKETEVETSINIEDPHEEKGELVSSSMTDTTEENAIDDVKLKTVQTTTITTTAPARTTTTNTSTNTTCSTVTVVTAKADSQEHTHISFSELRSKFAALEVDEQSATNTKQHPENGVVPSLVENCTEEINSDEEIMNRTDDLLENLQLHDYMNVPIADVFPPPPVPPRGGYNHISL
ncbi:phosphoinositide 3-kinase adapter protein 1 isoform X2 [Nilaparvata lugens]|uniref:phosphoinositide 3-kinase adapter protein 1 isoform X2 n=1 Tax=Nilaparvata lugens TaxID=108931 RepID=UPI00193D36AD|nr:phosphoinositide 3-kinase adapter protein 1 isoform X2 [Nilaparvata lugens]